MKHQLKQIMVTVADLKGKKHVMTRANATDMVQHAGWQIVLDTPLTPGQQFAQAPRTMEPAEHPVVIATRLALERKAAQEAAAEAEDQKPAAKAGRQKKKFAEDKESDGEDAVADVMPAVRAHSSQADMMAELENDEQSR